MSKNYTELHKNMKHQIFFTNVLAFKNGIFHHNSNTQKQHSATLLKAKKKKQQVSIQLWASSKLKSLLVEKPVMFYIHLWP